MRINSYVCLKRQCPSVPTEMTSKIFGAEGWLHTWFKKMTAGYVSTVDKLGLNQRLTADLQNCNSP